jgi:hypothetical protein
VIIDLDNDSIHDPEDSPLIAGAKDLIMKIEAIFELNMKDILIPRRVRRPGILLIKSGKHQREFDDFMKAHLHPFSVPSTYSRYKHKYLLSPVLVDPLVGLFRCQLAPKLEVLIRPCFITDTTDPQNPVTVFNRDLFLESVRPDDTAFYRAFMSTTMFQEFSDSLLDATSNAISSRNGSRSMSCLLTTKSPDV